MNNVIWSVTGDTHGDFSRFYNLTSRTEKINIIILGDAGINYVNPEQDNLFKRKLLKELPHINFYLVRGNHEQRPTNLPNIKTVYDEEVFGEIYIEEEFSNIRYFKDVGEYCIDGHKTLVLGGAYSVDKEIRLQRGYGWFADEQLSKEEMDAATARIKGKCYDLILSHTCPFDWMPTELFINGINNVDNTMELWMNDLKNKVLKNYGLWLFGHYHADLLIRPHVEMFYTDIEDLKNVWDRWFSPSDLGLPWWFDKSKDFYVDDNCRSDAVI